MTKSHSDNGLSAPLKGRALEGGGSSWPNARGYENQWERLNILSASRRHHDALIPSSSSSSRPSEAIGTSHQSGELGDNRVGNDALYGIPADKGQHTHQKRLGGTHSRSHY